MFFYFNPLLFAKSKFEHDIKINYKQMKIVFIMLICRSVFYFLNYNKPGNLLPLLTFLCKNIFETKTKGILTSPKIPD